MGLLDGALGDAVGGMLGNAAGNTGGNSQDLLGGLMGQLSGGQGANGNAMIATIMTLVQQHGGVAGIVQQFSKGGMSDLVATWVGTGANAPVSAAQVQQALGTSTVTDVASKLGVDPAQASSSIASMLPQLINSLTPNGAVDSSSGDLLSKGLSMLQGLQR